MGTPLHLRNSNSVIQRRVWVPVSAMAVAASRALMLAGQCRLHVLCHRSSLSQDQNSSPCAISIHPRKFSVSFTRAHFDLPFSATIASSGSVQDRKFIMMTAASTTDESQSLSSRFQTSPSPDVLTIWHDVDAVCFDVDSTVCVDEGIDELAKFCKAGDAVAALTARAMGGSVLFQDALAARLSIIKPSKNDVSQYLENNPPRLNPGIQDLVKKLKQKGVDVYLVSGGFRQMIEPVADILGIPHKNIFANRLLFDNDGKYSGFDPEEPTSRTGGKAAAVAKIKQEHGYKLMVMVGDGATDLEAKQPGGADAFICYGGIQLRERVAAAADWLVLSFDDLIKEVGGS